MKLFGIDLFKKISNQAIDEFAKGLTASLVKRVPPGTATPGSGKKGEKQLAKALNRVLVDAREFQREHRLGIYGKARVANTFKWELRELGYPDEFIEAATKAVVLSLS